MFSLLTLHLQPEKLNNPYIYSGGFIVKLRSTQNTELLISTILHAAVHGSVTYGCQLVKKWKLGKNAKVLGDVTGQYYK